MLANSLELTLYHACGFRESPDIIFYCFDCHIGILLPLRWWLSFCLWFFFFQPLMKQHKEMLGDDVISYHPLLHPFHRQTDSTTDTCTHAGTMNTGGGECHSFHTSILKVAVHLWYHSASLSVLLRCSCFPVIGNVWYEKVTLCVGVCMCICTPVFVRPIVSSRPSEKGHFFKVRTFLPILTSSNGY